MQISRFVTPQYNDFLNHEEPVLISGTDEVLMCLTAETSSSNMIRLAELMPEATSQFLSLEKQTFIPAAMLIQQQPFILMLMF